MKPEKCNRVGELTATGIEIIDIIKKKGLNQL